MNKNKLIWRTEKRKLKDLKPFENNPRKATEKQWQDLKKSLDKFNLADPLIINPDGKIIGGHFRYKVLKEKGVEEVDVRVPDRQLNDKEIKELNIRLNKNLGEWDFDLLADFDEDLLLDVGFQKEELKLAYDLLDLNGKEFDENIETKNECPKCGYEW